MEDKYNTKDPYNGSRTVENPGDFYSSRDPWPVGGVTGGYGFQNFLKDLNSYSSLAAVATGLLGLEPAMIVFTGISLSGKGIEMVKYSEHPYVDAAGESLKMTVPAPYSFITDKVVDMGLDALKERMDNKECK